MDDATFLEIAVEASTDNEVMQRLRDAGVRPPYIATFDPVRLNEHLHSGGS
jgi:hypothetical protein